MSEILNQAKKHYQDLSSRGYESVEVPEWPDKDGNPSLIYFRPVLTVKEYTPFYKFIRSDQIEDLVDALVMVARNEDGSKLFAATDKTELRDMVDGTVLTRIVEEIAGQIASVSQEDALKNLKPTPS